MGLGVFVYLSLFLVLFFFKRFFFFFLPLNRGKTFGLLKNLLNGWLKFCRTLDQLLGRFLFDRRLQRSCEGKPATIADFMCLSPLSAYSTAGTRCDFFAGARLVPSSALRGMARRQRCMQRVLWNTSACWLLAQERGGYSKCKLHCASCRICLRYPARLRVGRCSRALQQRGNGRQPSIRDYSAGGSAPCKNFCPRPPGRSPGETLVAVVDNAARTIVRCNKGPNEASRKGAIQL